MSQMSYRRLGMSGLVVSVVGIGCNNFGRKLDTDGTRAVVDAAFDAGITLFDTADTYGTPHGASAAPPSGAAGTPSCCPPSPAWTGRAGTVRIPAPAPPAATSCERSSRRCA